LKAAVKEAADSIPTGARDVILVLEAASVQAQLHEWIIIASGGSGERFQADRDHARTELVTLKERLDQLSRDLRLSPLPFETAAFDVEFLRPKANAKRIAALRESCMQFSNAVDGVVRALEVLTDEVPYVMEISVGPDGETVAAVQVLTPCDASA